MGKEIIISARKDQTRIAIVEDDELAEMYFEDPENERTLGDIYLGRVRRIMPSIQAAFIDIGQPSDAFLHFSDIADNVGDMIRLLSMNEPDVGKVELSAPVRQRRPRGPSGTHVSMDDDEDHAEEEGRSKDGSGRRDRGGRSEESFRPEDLKKDQKILVKIVKEPISSKGSRVSTDISLAGRFLVLVPLADYVAVSKKIVSYKERRRLRALAKSLLPEGFGLIVRTVAEEKNAKALDTDLRLLVEKWRRIEKRLSEVKTPPAVLHQDVNMVSSVIRDLFSDDYEQILIDDQRVYRNVKGYIQAVAPQMAPAVKFHTDRQSIFQTAGIDKAVRQAFESRVDLPSGGYLIIEHTEAMHVIDVNSGRAGRGLSQEQNSLRVNIESARMIAQQLRLRDLGGIIVVDFIDLRDDKNRKKVYDELKKNFRKDRAVTKILPMSDFGLMQITRQRLRPSITTVKKTDEKKGAAAAAFAPNADRRSEASAAPRMTPDEWREKLERWVVRYHEKGKRDPLTLKIHPFAKSYLGKGLTKASVKWFWKYRLRVAIETDTEQNPMSFRFFDAASGDELTRRSRSGRRRGKRKGKNQGESDGSATGKSGDAKAKSKSSSGRQQSSGKSSRSKSTDRSTDGGSQKRESRSSTNSTAESRDGKSRDGKTRDGKSRRGSRRGRGDSAGTKRDSSNGSDKRTTDRSKGPSDQRASSGKPAENSGSTSRSSGRSSSDNTPRSSSDGRQQTDKSKQRRSNSGRRGGSSAQRDEGRPATETGSKPKAENRPDAGANPNAAGRPDNRPERRTETRPEARPEARPETRPEARPERPTETQADQAPSNASASAPKPSEPKKSADPIRTMYSSHHRPKKPDTDTSTGNGKPDAAPNARPDESANANTDR